MFHMKQYCAIIALTDVEAIFITYKERNKR